jgi:2'-5' RNA ligase
MCSSATEPRQRLFFALWPDATVRQSLVKSSRELLGRRVKQVAAENLHITLAFAGPVIASVRDCLMEAAGGIHCASFDLVIDHVGHWPRPRILWVGPTHAPLALWTLVEALNQTFDNCGLQRETRPFQAHVTLARKVGKALPAPVVLNPVVWSVSEFSLMESVTDARGASYQRLASWKLEGG